MGEMDKVEFLSIFDQITQYCYSNNNIGKMTINTMRVFILIIVSQADLKTISGWKQAKALEHVSLAS